MEKKREISTIIKKIQRDLLFLNYLKKISVSRQTVSNCFAFLEGAEQVRIRPIGKAKLYYWKGAHSVRIPKKGTRTSHETSKNSKTKFLQEAKK